MGTRIAPRAGRGVRPALVLCVLAVAGAAAFPSVGNHASAASPGQIRLKLPRPGDASIAIVPLSGRPSGRSGPGFTLLNRREIPLGTTVLYAVRRPGTGSRQAVLVVLRRKVAPARRGAERRLHGVLRAQPNAGFVSGLIAADPGATGAPRILANVVSSPPTGDVGDAADELAKFGRFLLWSHVVRDPELASEVGVPADDQAETIIDVAAGEETPFGGALVAGLAGTDLTRVFIPAKKSGAFGLGVSIGLSGVPSAIDSGDIDLDATPDIAVATSGGVKLFELGPQGGVDPYAPVPGVDFPAPRGVSGVALADINADGLHDIIALNRGAGTIGTALATPGGGFLDLRTLSAGSRPGPLLDLSADLDGDGRADFVIPRNRRGFDVLQGAPAGITLTPGPPAGAGIPAAAGGLADIDGDGLVDAVLAGSLARRTPGLWLFRGDGAGGFTPPTMIAPPPAGIPYDPVSARRLLDEAGWVDTGQFGSAGAGSDVVIASGDPLPPPGSPLFLTLQSFRPGAPVLDIFGGDILKVGDLDRVGGDNDAMVVDKGSGRYTVLLNVSLVRDKPQVGRVIPGVFAPTRGTNRWRMQAVRDVSFFRSPLTGVTDVAVIGTTRAGAGVLSVHPNLLRTGVGGGAPAFLTHPALPPLMTPGVATTPPSGWHWFLQTTPADALIARLQAAGAQIASTGPALPADLAVRSCDDLPGAPADIVTLLRAAPTLLGGCERHQDGTAQATALRDAMAALSTSPHPPVYFAIGPRPMSTIAAGLGPDSNLGRDGKPHFATFRDLIGAAARADGVYFDMYHTPGFGQPVTPFTVDEWLRGPDKVGAIFVAAAGDLSRLHFTMTAVGGMPHGYPAGRATTPMGAQFDLARQPINLPIFDNGLGAVSLGDPAPFLAEAHAGFPSLP